MDAKRAIRHWLTSRITAAGIRAAPRLSAGAVDFAESVVGRAAAHAPLLSRLVADNMRAVGLYSPAVHRAYFARVARHFGGILHVFRHARRAAADDGGLDPRLAGVVEKRVQLDESFRVLREAAGKGKGVVLMGAHPVDFMLALARLNQELPISVYLRHSKAASKQEAKRRWCRTVGLSYIAEPASAANPARRAEVMADALTQGRVLVITPDLVQHRDEGVPVRFFDREVYLPGGAAALALVVEAPLMAVLARPAGEDAICLAFHGPADAQTPGRGKGRRQEATRRLMQWFADLMVNDFLKPHPELWFLWGDKRWTRVFRGDPRYTRLLV
ncbi:MAG: hypothetical protein AMXMBFR83_15820 [Phycisphaerae bacterium]